MEHIIQQITVDLASNVLKKAYEGGIRDLDGLADDLLCDCKNAARQMLKTILEHLDEQLYLDKEGRKERGLVLHEHGRPRSLLTGLGLLEWKRDHYKDALCGGYRYPLDEITGVHAYERVGDAVSAKLLNTAAEVSYAKSADIVTGGAVSRQTVRNKLLKLTVPEKESPEKRSVRELHVYADEDHVHMQKPGKERGKQNQILPLVTVAEGVRRVCAHRNATIRPTHFVDEHFDTKQLWKSVAGYIGSAYEVAKIEKIYLHGDGGSWIKSGLSDFAQTERVMDTFHFSKKLRALCRAFPARNVRTVILHALEQNDRGHADAFLQELADEAKTEWAQDKVKKFGTYLFRFWEENRKAMNAEISGSCTEGQVSHVLSERFSRDPLGWSEEGLGKLAKVRVSVKNGRPIVGADFKPHGEQETYAQYADRLIEESLCGAKDWSLFEPALPTYDSASGTQMLIHIWSENRGLLN